MTVVPSHYVHGSHPYEQQRLTALNAFINARMLPEMRLTGGERIVDFGSGLGQFTRLLAKAARSERPVIGIERDERQINEAKRQALAAGETHLVEFRSGDVSAPPLRDEEWGSFDLAHARFILEHVPDPLAVVRNMVRAVRPGGRIVLADDDHDVLRLWPALPAFDQVWRAYMNSYTSAGNDPIVGRRMVELLHAAGAQPLRNTWVFFGSCSGEDIWPLVVSNLIGVVESARAEVLRQGFAAEQLDRALSDVHEWSLRPDVAIWYAIALAEGMRP
jgi:ubiquinone/menaquinone biosynthesis C-methylase UbiE